MSFASSLPISTHPSTSIPPSPSPSPSTSLLSLIPPPFLPCSPPSHSYPHLSHLCAQIHEHGIKYVKTIDSPSLLLQAVMESVSYEEKVSSGCLLLQSMALLRYFHLVTNTDPIQDTKRAKLFSKRFKLQIITVSILIILLSTSYHHSRIVFCVVVSLSILLLSRGRYRVREVHW